MRLIGDKESCSDLISVVVPVYNVEACLNRCVESLVSQTYTNLEIILVDDGSKDGSGALCDRWTAHDPRIKTIHKENGGLSSARNAGIDIAAGDYIGFVDSDDYVELDMYEIMHDAICSSGKKIACCGRIVHLSDTWEKRMYTLPAKREYDKAESIKRVLLGDQIDVAAWDKLYVREVFDSIRYPVGKISEDSSIIMELLDCSNGVVHVGTPLYHYVFRSDSISKSSYKSEKYDAFEHCLSIRSFIRESYPQFEDECKVYCCYVASCLLQSMLSCPGAKKKYKSEYDDYCRMLKDTISSYVSSDTVGYKDKIRVLSIACGVYAAFDRLNRIRKRLHSC